jgi:YesN/AraC family two-component response regulator
VTQYFLKQDGTPIFEDGSIPKLLYICDVDQAYTRLPRIMHSHNDITEIVFIKEGSGYHVIGDQKYSTRKGDILIYNSNVLHDEMANPNTSMSVYCCGITNLKLKGLPENHLVSEEVSYVLHSGEQAEQIEALLKMMCSQVQEEKSGAEGMCNYLLCALISLILQIPQEITVLSKSEKSFLSNRIKQYIDENYLEEINLESIAQSLSISPFYLVHVFKESTGFSPIQYIIRRRIGEAQSLLINTAYSVTQIAGMVGYDNISYFTTLFSKTVGMTPKKYRQLWTKMAK